MAGLFDFLSTEDPNQAAYNAMMFGLLGGKGNLNQRLSQGGMNAMDVSQKYKGAQRQREQDKLMEEYRRAQMAEMEAKSRARTDQLAKGLDPDEPKDIATWRLFEKMTPQQQANFILSKRSDYSLKDINGILNRVSNSGLGSTTPLTNIEDESAGQAAIAGAKQRAQEIEKANYDLSVPAFTGSGQNAQRVPVTRAQLLGQMGGGQATPDSSTRIPAPVQAARDVDRMKILQAELAKATDPRDKAALTREIARTNMAGLLASKEPVRLGLTPREEASNKALEAAQVEAGKKEGAAAGQAAANLPNTERAANSVKDAIKLLDEGIYTGIYSNIAKTGAKLIPGVDKSKASRTEDFMMLIGELVIPRLQEFGGNDSNEELRYLQKVMAGDISLEENALRSSLKRSEKFIEDGIQRAKSNPLRVNQTGAGSQFNDSDKERRYQEWKKRQGQ